MSIIFVTNPKEPNEDVKEETTLLVGESVESSRERITLSTCISDTSTSGMAILGGPLQASSGPKVSDVLELCIYLRDQTVIPLKVNNGQQAQTEDLFRIVQEEQKLPPEAANVFSLWLVSPSLELRLKKNHRPYYLVQQWQELCKLYTDQKAEYKLRDTPLLMLQRNVFYSKEEEMKLNDETTLSLLYHEAQYNVLEGRYVVDKLDYDELAAIQFIIEEGNLIGVKGLTQNQRHNLERFYPEFLCKRRWQIPGLKNSSRNDIEVRFEEAVVRISQALPEQYSKVSLYKMYLQLLWNTPFYGSAYFSAVVDRPTSKLQMVFGVHSMHVWVCINTEGVCIIEKDKDFVDLAVPFTEMSWHFHDDLEDEKLPSLFIQFLVKDGEETVTKLLEINSRQAKLMNALIDSMVKRKRQQQHVHRPRRYSEQSYDSVDGAISSTFNKSLNKLKRLSLDTYTVAADKIPTKNWYQNMWPVVEIINFFQQYFY
ncbi:putative FERM domain-containing protein FRMD8P1 isoform X3 [Octopus bimaculoides]|uniref:putative FERM domain-containing protein FRMD8P1 isoform X3 n=1 Tax=Octopus bimaculoides TaxID=37653 RepID=UPI0022E965DE|nr:putative FERM domain-containing protein FRMD8P1 isoform X3 [Octopus bimaculoides]